MHRVNVFSGHVSADGAACAVAKPVRTITLTDSSTGKQVTIPVEDNCIKATDLKKLGIQSFDPGYMNTTCCVSRISFIDGGKGILRHRGLPIEVLADKSDFKPLSFVPGKVNKIDHNKPSTYGPAPTGGVTKQK